MLLGFSAPHTHTQPHNHITVKCYKYCIALPARRIERQRAPSVRSFVRGGVACERGVVDGGDGVGGSAAMKLLCLNDQVNVINQRRMRRRALARAQVFGKQAIYIL